AAARNFGSGEADVSEAATLLAALERSTPPGDSPDAVSSTSAQDCWICADVCIRVLVDETYDAGPAIEYALEPVVSAATQDLYGVSQLGSSEDEDARVQAVLAHPTVSGG